jgi:adenylate cyclase class 2
MKHVSPLEVEIKLAIPGLEGFPARLEAAGFRLVSPQGPETSVLWDRDGQLRSQGSALRVRRYDGAVTLTWKGPRVDDPVLKIRPEQETAVADGEAMEAILRALGYAPALTMVKSRAVWVRGELEACLDQAPFGCYLELEGTREAIQGALGELGLAGLPVEPRSYASLFLDNGC